MEKQYLTVKEFAAAANVTPQRIYKLLSKDNGLNNELNNGLSNRLKPYIKIENNQKYLSIRALELFEKNKNSQRVEQQVEQPIEQRVEQQVDPAPGELTAQAAIAALEKQLEVMQQQLQVKDKQISELTNALTCSQEQQKALTEALTAAQALHAGTLQKQLATEQQPPESDELTAPQDLTTDPEPEQENKKASLFTRLFKRSKKQR